jgi:hypothetical protein
MIKLICIEPSRGDAYKKAKARLNKVGYKCGYFSWYVDAKMVPTRLLKNLNGVAIINLDGRITMNSITRAISDVENLAKAKKESR